MSQLDEIVEIILTRGSTAIETASFQIPLALVDTAAFSERVRQYNSMDSVEDDFDAGDPAHTIALRMFGQTTVGAKPPYILIGRRQVDEVTLTPVVADNSNYIVNINGTSYTFTSGEDATAAQIVTGLDTAIGTVTGINATVSGGTLVVEVATPGTAWSINASSNLTQAQATPTESWVDALAAVEDVNDTFYAVVAETHDPVEVEAISDAINARRKLYFTSTQDPAATTTALTDIAAILDNKNADRSVVVYSPTADTQYPEAAWVGGYLPFTPGTIDWNLKQASGITRAVLNDTARSNLSNKNANYYTRLAGVDVFRNGDTSGGSPIDEIQVLDWLYARLQEGIYFRLINSLKVPMTNVGMTIIENEIRAVLSQAEANGAIDSGWKVVSPNVLSIPATQRAQRIAGTFTFTARLAGAVRKVVINGRLEV